MKALVIAVAAAGVLVAGCGTRTAGTASSPAVSTVTDDPSGSATDTASGTPGTDTDTATATATDSGSPSGSGTPAAGSRCGTADLTGSLRQLDAAAGNRYATLVLTNTSQRTCTLFGYGGIQLAAADRRPVVTMQVRDHTRPPATVRLQPGATASSLLHWGAVPSGSEPVMGACEATPALLLVIPPDEHDQLSVRWTFGPVCQRGKIDQRAYVAGIVTE